MMGPVKSSSSNGRESSDQAVVTTKSRAMIAVVFWRSVELGGLHNVMPPSGNMPR